MHRKKLNNVKLEENNNIKYKNRVVQMLTRGFSQKISKFKLSDM